MNASNRFFATRVGLVGSSLAASCLLVGACTTVEAAASGKTMVPEVVAISRAEHGYPTFAGIPATPTDLRPVKAWGVAAGASEADRIALEQATAESTWTLSGTEVFAAKALRDAGPAMETASSTTAATEAYARELRRRATPPPPPKR